MDEHEREHLNRADPSAFTDEANWSGGFYELSLELGPVSDERLDRALGALWQAAGIIGCYRQRNQAPTDQPLVAPSVASLDSCYGGALAGVAPVLHHGRVVTLCSVTRYDDEEDAPHTDSLSLGLPLGALGRTDPRIGGYPFGPDGGESSLSWRTGLDSWLAKIATDVFAEVPFLLGQIGFELDYTTAAELQGVVPDPRFEGYLLPTKDRLTYFPANQ